MPEDYEDEGVIIYTRLKKTLNCVRFVHDHILGCSINMVFDYAINPEGDPEEMVFAWRKIEYFMDSLEQIMMVHAGNPLSVSVSIDSTTQSCRFANPIMLTPEEPTEDHFATLLLSKLNKLGAGSISFGGVEVESLENHGIIVAVSGFTGDDLPTMVNWMGPNNWFDQPWWARDDGSTYDAFAPEETDVSQRPDWAYDWEFLREKPRAAGLVLNAGFKPRLVPQGDDDGE